jgi:signal transduction histidine kinase
MGKMKDGLVRLSEDVHALSYRLHPSILADLGLQAALRSECEQMSESSAIVVDLDADDIPEQVPQGARLCLFRIAQECLRNAARHASASRVEVRVWQSGKALQLTVRDDGIGFDHRKRREKPSLGLASMRQRVSLLGGDIKIASKPFKGTKIWVSVPTQPNVSA